VSLSDWEAEHMVHDEDLMIVTAEAEWAEECGDDECGDDMAPNVPAGVVNVASADTRDQRTEKLVDTVTLSRRSCAYCGRRAR
jgi:hypothetical protein